MDVERLLPADALRPRWSSASALVYLGGFVVLGATSSLLGILGEDHGDWALAGYSALAVVVAFAFAHWLAQSGRAVAAGVLATLAVIFFATFVGSLANLLGILDAELGDYQAGALIVELATIAAGVRRVAALPGASADAADRRHALVRGDRPRLAGFGGHRREGALDPRRAGADRGRRRRRSRRPRAVRVLGPPRRRPLARRRRAGARRERRGLGIRRPALAGLRRRVATCSPARATPSSARSASSPRRRTSRSTAFPSSVPSCRSAPARSTRAWTRGRSRSRSSRPGS